MEKEYLTKEVAEKYRLLGKELNAEYQNQNIGRKREVILEMIHKYGILEIEAINILNGFYINDYVEKYERLQKGIQQVNNFEELDLEGDIEECQNLVKQQG